MLSVYECTEWDYPDNIKNFPFKDFLDVCKEALKWKREASYRQQPQSGNSTFRIDKDIIKEKSDIVVVVEGYVKLRKAGHNYVGLCPFHDERHASFTVYPEQQSWHCYSCNKGGDVITFVQMINNVDFNGACEILSNG